MSEEWGIKTGTLYFHLKELGDMIDQGGNKEYVLSPIGKELCEFFIRSSEGKAKINEIDAFTSVVRPLYLRLERSNFIQLILYVIMLGGLISASMVNIFLIGPIPLPADIDRIWIFVINFSLFALQCIIIGAMLKILDEFRIWSVLRTISLANIVVALFSIVLISLFFLPFDIHVQGVITFEIWLFVSIFSQICYISMISGSMILVHNMRPIKSLLVSIISMYMITSLALVIAF